MIDKAITPVKAIRLLWENLFFKENRLTKEVRKKAFDDFGCTADNWTDLLKKSNDIIRRNDNYWIQKINPTNKGLQVVMVEAGKPMTSRKTFEDIIADFNDDVYICDPYLSKDTLNALVKFNSKKIKFLFFEKNKKLLESDISDFKKEYPNVELRIFPHPHLHDRYILSKDKLLIIGHGLSIGNKESFIIRIEKRLCEDLIQSLLSIFNSRWSKSSII